MVILRLNKYSNGYFTTARLRSIGFVARDLDILKNELDGEKLSRKLAAWSSVLSPIFTILTWVFRYENALLIFDDSLSSSNPLR